MRAHEAAENPIDSNINPPNEILIVSTPATANSKFVMDDRFTFSSGTAQELASPTSSDMLGIISLGYQ